MTSLRVALQTSIMMWRQIFTFVQSAMLDILGHPWGFRIWAIAGAVGDFTNQI